MQQFFKAISRDFCLLMFEIWKIAEPSLATEVFLKKIPKSLLPFLIFINENGLTSLYANTKTNKWLYRLIIENISHRRNFFKYKKEYRKYLKLLKNFWGKGKVKNKTQLLRLIELIKKSFPYNEIFYLAPNILEVPEKIRHLSLQERKRGDLYSENCDRALRSALRYLYPKLGGYEKFIRYNEIFNRTIPERKGLIKRSKYYLLCDQTFLTNKKNRFLKDNNLFILKKDLKGSTIKGEVVNKGLYQGKARVILLKDRIGELKKGEVLVSYMTTPDYYTVIKKAGAIITDEGGITCHAAIVARELKKPCIIGTKIATKVLKDGDLVEVDAEKGVVKILKRVK